MNLKTYIPDVTTYAQVEHPKLELNHDFQIDCDKRAPFGTHQKIDIEPTPPKEKDALSRNSGALHFATET